MIAIGRAGRGVNKTFCFRVPCGDQHVDEASDVAVIAHDRIFDRAWHRAERGVVQDVADLFTSVVAGRDVRKCHRE